MTWTRTAADFIAIREGLEKAVVSLAKGQPPTDLDFDVAEWVFYLLWLRSCLDASVLAPSQLNGEELEGIRLHDEVIRGLQGRLRRCPHESCGRLTDQEMTCEHCHRPLASKPGSPRQ